MQTLINALRDIIGTPNFYRQLQGNNGSYTYQWDYGAMIEYMVAAMLLMVVVSWIFKSIRWLFSR